MSKNTEATIARTIANFDLLLTNLINIGDKYNPNKEAFKITVLNALKTSVATAHKAAGDEKITYRRVVAERAAVFEPLDKLTTRCLNIFLTSDALEQVKNGAKSMADKIRGVDNSPAPPPPAEGETEEDNDHSTSQRSYVMKAENFGIFVSMLKAEPSYLPSTDDIKTDSLGTFLENLKTKNSNADSAFISWKTKLTLRDNLLYEENTGLVNIALDVKNYVKGELGTDSDAYKSIKGIPFPKKRKNTKKKK